MDKEILADIKIIDGAIIEDKDLIYKKEILSQMESKYRDIIKSKKYVKMEEKVDKYIEDEAKDINTKLGAIRSILTEK